MDDFISEHLGVSDEKAKIDVNKEFQSTVRKLIMSNHFTHIVVTYKIINTQ
jgi:hypothetical protein